MPNNSININNLLKFKINRDKLKNNNTSVPLNDRSSAAPAKSTFEAPKQCPRNSLHIDTGARAAQMKVSPMFRVQTTDEFVQATSELLGQDNVRLPVENVGIM